MRIGIIGAGFTGLAAGLKLQKCGHQVTIFEKEALPGGLAIGFTDPKWQWTLEEHYHHCFSNDNKILDLAKEINFPMLTKQPDTSVYVNDKFYKLDSPLDVLKFSELNLLQRLRMGLTIAFLKYNPLWKSLEKYKMSVTLPKLMGEKAYRLLWEPLINKKFGPFASDISLAWFWARVVKRTPSLVYPQGGFLRLANSIVSEIRENGGKVILSNEVKEIISLKEDHKVKVDSQTFDKVIVTLPSFLFAQVTPQLPFEYKKKMLDLKELSVINLILRLKKPFFKDNTYWMNVCDMSYPLTGIVEHTNFMNKKYYNNESLVYLLNYLPQDHPYINMDKIELLKLYDPLLRTINAGYKSNIIDLYRFKAIYAQPVIYTNYSKIIPPFVTPLKNVYLANIQQVYPWDRGANYAVELGEKIADIIFD
jgi:protoporphyrinogen oxidase